MEALNKMIRLKEKTPGSPTSPGKSPNKSLAPKSPGKFEVKKRASHVNNLA